MRGLLVAAFLYAPAIGLCVLLGFALGWWFPAVVAAGSAILIGWALIYRRRLRRLPSDPDARRAREERIYRRSVRWVKIWGLSFVGMMMFLFVLALVVLVVERS
jgi:hypothetical protein